MSLLTDLQRQINTLKARVDRIVRTPAPTSSSGNSSTFIALTDTPSTYSGQGLKVVRVNTGATALEFVTLAGGGDMLASNNLSEVTPATARTNLGLSTTANQSDSSNKRFVTDAQLTVIGNTSGTNSGDNATNTQYSGLASSKLDATAFAGLAKITVGTSTPGSPTTGDLWIDTN